MAPGFVMSEAAVVPKRGGPSRTRLIGARALTVVAILLALVGMLAYYVAHTALDDSGFETISRNMIESDAIRTQVAITAVDTLYANVDVEAAIADRLPPAQQGLAPVLAGLSRSVADRAAETALERPRVQTVWVETTTATQRQLVRLLDDETAFESEGGRVVLDLSPIVIQIGDQVAIIGRVAEKLPDSAGKITIIEESQLETAQTITRILRTVANWMWLIAIAVAALAIWLARGRRRLELRALAIGVLVVGLLMLVVRRAAGGYLVDELAKDDSVKPAVQDAWDILTQTLADRAWVWITLGVVRWPASGSSVRPVAPARHAAPRSPSYRTAWRPTPSPPAPCSCSRSSLHCSPATGRASLVMLALVVVGIEVVRNIVEREATARTAERLAGATRTRRLGEGFYLGGIATWGRRRAVQVARRVEASAGWCVYSSLTAITSKPAPWREARTSASAWKYCRCRSQKGSPSRGRVSSTRVSQVRAPGSTTLLITKSFPAASPATTALADREVHHRVGVEVEHEPSGGPKPAGQRDHRHAQLVRGEVVEAVERADGGVEDTFERQVGQGHPAQRRRRGRAARERGPASPRTRRRRRPGSPGR